MWQSLSLLSCHTNQEIMFAIWHKCLGYISVFVSFTLTFLGDLSLKISVSICLSPFLVKPFNIPKSVASLWKWSQTYMYKTACTYGIHFYLQLFMQHQYKPYDFAEIHIAFSPTINLVNVWGFINVYFYNHYHIIKHSSHYFPCGCHCWCFHYCLFNVPFWSTVGTSCLFLDWAFALCCVQIESTEFLMKFLHVYFNCMPNDEALL